MFQLHLYVLCFNSFSSNGNLSTETLRIKLIKCQFKQMEDQAMQSKNKLKSKSREELQKNEIYRARDMK